MSKLIVARAYYEVFLPRWPESKVILSDTDSFIFAVPGVNPDEEFEALKEHFDFSNYEEQHPHFSLANSKKLGLWKNESGGSMVIEAAIALRSKVYALKQAPNQYARPGTLSTQVLKAKGVSRIGLQKLCFDDYKRALEETVKISTSFHVIRKKDFKLSIAEIRKVALSSFDEKRALYPCARHSYPYGSVEPLLFNGQCPYCNNISLQEQQRLLESFLSSR